MLALISSAANRYRFHSAPLAQWAVVVWRPFRVAHGTSIPQRGHRGWGRLPFSRMTTVSLTCLCRKYILSAALVAALPLHPSTGKSRSPVTLRKDIRNACGLSGGGGIPLPPPSCAHVNAILCLPVDHQQPRHQVRTTVRTLKRQALSVLVGESLPCHPLHVSYF